MGVGVARCPKGAPFWISTKAAGPHWTSLQTDNHIGTASLNCVYRPAALPEIQPAATQHWRYNVCVCVSSVYASSLLVCTHSRVMRCRCGCLSGARFIDWHTWNLWAQASVTTCQRHHQQQHQQQVDSCDHSTTTTTLPPLQPPSALAKWTARSTRVWKMGSNPAEASHCLTTMGKLFTPTVPSGTESRLNQLTPGIAGTSVATLGKLFTCVCSGLLSPSSFIDG